MEERERGIQGNEVKQKRETTEETTEKDGRLTTMRIGQELHR